MFAKRSAEFIANNLQPMFLLLLFLRQEKKGEAFYAKEKGG